MGIIFPERGFSLSSFTCRIEDMENTDRLLRGDSAGTAEWFVAQGEDWTGPFGAAEVYSKIVSHEIAWTHLGWKAGMETWKKLSEIPEILALVPKPKAPADAPRDWFLYFNDTQYGPFSQPELKVLLEKGKVHSRVHGWKKGMEKWERLERISELATLIPSTPPALPPRVESKAKAQDRRISSRRPMEARILLAQGQEVSDGICRDVSVGGMQVLTSQIPGPVGTRIKLNIDTRTQAGDPPQPFTADGSIVRVLEDGRGFCFRFEKLDDSARKAIEEWIKKIESST